jgi:hypothetical protein
MVDGLLDNTLGSSVRKARNSKRLVHNKLDSV